MYPDDINDLRFVELQEIERENYERVQEQYQQYAIDTYIEYSNE